MHPSQTSNNRHNTAVAASHDSLLPKAQALAAQLSLPLVEATCDDFPLLLMVTEQRIELQQIGPGAPGPLFVDFVCGAANYRRKHGGGRKQAIAKAAGLKKGLTPTLIDATAGLGRDAFVLAGLGCRVQLIERSPIIAALLQDGIDRAKADPGLTSIVTDNMTLTVGDSTKILHEWQAKKPDVIFIDPMYPHREKSALVKKEMRLIRMVVGDDQDSTTLLETALAVAGQRVVVKRPIQAPCLTGRAPSFTINCKKNRFDVYLV
ncbi:MAG: class I SAM-dependent methyltransferase [Desulfobulbaceae bacterium]|nr:class I SAM-dependent methyltransferase [Desulfobulbaceae bacterium]HIJ78180.1 class I SAM-dependent methyltransferase [Deltaproteobacteria bacterium]